MYDFNFLCMIALRNKLTRKIVEISINLATMVT